MFYIELVEYKGVEDRKRLRLMWKIRRKVRKGVKEHGNIHSES